MRTDAPLHTTVIGHVLTAATTDRGAIRAKPLKPLTIMPRQNSPLSILSVFLLLLASALLVGCGQRRVEEFRFCSTPVDGWENSDSLVFPINTIRQDGDYCLSIGVRTSAANSYPFRTLVLSITTRIRGAEVEHDTAYCDLTDADGDLNGQGVSLYQYVFPVSVLHFRKGQSGTVLIHHIMRRRLLSGVANIGIRIERVK